VLAGVQPVLEALRAHACGPALAWCADNRARLKKIKSTLEFRLRVQEFLELVRQVRQECVGVGGWVGVGVGVGVGVWV
jgi:macrophage erythroblast attacher